MTDAAALLPGALGWILIAVGLLSFARNVERELAERVLLRRTLREICPSGLRSRDDLLSVKRFLNERIRWDPERKNDPRPLLRHSATEILESGYGLCGENARLAIRLLSVGGVRAHRLYLEGPRWGHVIVEHEWEGGWRLFDGHVDSATAMLDAMVGRVHPEQFRALPNSFERNPWVQALRIRPLARLPLLGFVGEWRPPRWVGTLVESPHLLRALASFVAAGIGLLALMHA